MSISLSQYKNKDRVLLIEAGRLHPAFSFSRASTATYLNGVGVLVTAATNTPRFEYDGSGNYLGLLIEEGRTNLCIQSQLLTSSPWLVSNVSVASNAANYRGITYFKIAKTNTTISASFTTPFNAVANGASLTVTFALRADTSSQMQFGIFGDSGGAFGLTADTSAAIMSGVGSLSRSNGLFLITGLSSSTDTLVTVTRTFTSAQSYKLSLYPGGAASRTTGASVLVTRVQIESALTGTSYIPTTTATVTRATDVAQATLSTIGVSTTQGTFVIEHDAPSGQPLICSGSNVLLASSGGTKVAIGYDATGWSKSVNGGAVTTSGTPLTFGSTLDIGKSPTGGANGHIKRVSWYRTRRPNAELMRLSV